MGDTAMLVPVVRSLAIACPDMSITMLSQGKWAALWNNMPQNVSFFGADLKGRHKGLTGLNTLLTDINYRQFNLVADMHNVWRSKYITLHCSLAGAKYSCLDKQRIQRWLLTHGHKRELRPMVLAYTDVLNRLGFNSINITTPSVRATCFNKKIGIAPFAAHKGKTYPIEKMEQVVSMLSAKDYIITLFGGKGREAQILEEWQQKYDNVYSVAGTLSLDREIQLMGTLSLMITMDSANLHLASLASTRVVSIWGATHTMAGFLPKQQSTDDCLQLDLPCRPCSIFGNKSCRYGDWRCLNIPPETIVRHIESAICKTL